MLLKNGLTAFYVLLWEPITRYSLIHRLLPAIVGTATVIGLTLVLASPLGIAIGVWSSLFASSRSKKFMNLVIQARRTIIRGILIITAATLIKIPHHRIQAILTPARKLMRQCVQRQNKTIPELLDQIQHKLQ